MRPKASHRIVPLVTTGGHVGGINMNQVLNNMKA